MEWKSEIDDFLYKFYQLQKAGFTAHFDLDTNAGQAWVGLRVMLGTSHKEQKQSTIRKRKNKRGPAYERRQERRQAERAKKSVNAEKAEAVVDKAEKVVIEREAEEAAATP